MLTHYVIVRSDLPVGFLASQVVHAAGESSTGRLDSGTYAVVLGAKDLRHLEDIERLLQKAGIAHVAIREPETPWNGQLTAIGCVPVADRTPIRRLLSSLPLYGRERPSKECEHRISRGHFCYECNGGLPRRQKLV